MENVRTAESRGEETLHFKRREEFLGLYEAMCLG